MNYFINRNGQEYGPYTIGDLQRYGASGQILLTDLARGEGTTELVAVSQILGAVASSQPQLTAIPMAAGANRNPPNLHWGLVLLFDILTCGLFSAVWNIVQAEWMKRVAPQSQAFNYYIASICCLVATAFVTVHARHTHHNAAGLLNLVYCVLLLIGRFSLKASLEQYYNTVEPIGLALSGVMTFFFGDIYFQYHFNEIMRRKRAAFGSLPA